MGLVLGLGGAITVVSEALTGTPAARVFDLAVPSASYYIMALAAFLRGRAVPRERQGWWFLSLAGLLVGTGGFLRLGLPSLESGSLVVMLLGGISQGAGILAWPHAPRTLQERINKAMDGMVFALALFFILWVLGWGQIYHASAQGLARRLFTLGFPLLPIAVLGVVIYISASRPFQHLRGPLGWIALGLLLSFLGNMAWGILTLQGSYGLGNRSWEALSFFIPLCRLAAPFSAHPVLDAPSTESQDHRRLAIIIPYFPVVPALLLGAWFLRKTGVAADPVPPWLGIAMVSLLLARQYRAIRQQHRLSESLEQRVLDRTRDLEESQAVVLQVQRMNTVASLGAGLAHDLNNLLGAAKLSVSLVEDEAAVGNPPKETDLERINVALERATGLTASLMDLVREEPGHVERFDLEAQVREAEPLLRAILPRNVQLEFEWAGSPLMIRSHPSQWLQILVNLVSNARDAMPDGGHIAVRLAAERDGLALMEVEDDGQGMSSDVKARVFEPFFTTKTRGKGTGLGLASVKLLVTKAGGHLDLWSEVGRGTRFSIRVPCAADPVD